MQSKIFWIIVAIGALLMPGKEESPNLSGLRRKKRKSLGLGYPKDLKKIPSNFITYQLDDKHIFFVDPTPEIYQKRNAGLYMGKEIVFKSYREDGSSSGYVTEPELRRYKKVNIEQSGQMKLFGLGRLSKEERERVESFTRYGEAASKLATNTRYGYDPRQKALIAIGYKEFPRIFDNRVSARKLADQYEESTIINKGKWIDGSNTFVVMYKSPSGKPCEAEDIYLKKKDVVTCKAERMDMPLTEQVEARAVMQSNTPTQMRLFGIRKGLDNRKD